MSGVTINLEEFIFSCKEPQGKVILEYVDLEKVEEEEEDDSEVNKELFKDELLAIEEEEEEGEGEDENEDPEFDISVTKVIYYVDNFGNVVNDLSGGLGGTPSAVSLASASAISSVDPKSQNGDESKLDGKRPFLRPKQLTCEDIQKGYSKLGDCKEHYNILSIANHGLTELGTITNLTSLTEIDVSRNYLRCIRGLGVMQYLQKINASSNDVEQFLDLCPIPIGLKEVDFSKNCISKTLNLKPFWSLTDINLSYNSLTEVTGFEHMVYLKSLNLSHNMISKIHLNCPNLIILNLKANCLSHTISGFEKCANISSLNLARNHFSEIGGLKHFGSIVELHLERNDIVDLLELDNLKFLMYLHCLWIHHNKISELEHSRLMLIHTLPQLLLLDDRKVTVEEMRDAVNIFEPSFIKLSCEDHTNTLADRACQPANAMYDTYREINPSPPIILLVGTPKSECHKMALLLKEKFRHFVHLGGIHSTAATLEGSNLDIPVTLEAFAEMKNRGDFLSTCHILGRICGFSSSQISRAVERKSILVATVPLGIAISMRKWKMKPKLVLVLPSKLPELVSHGPPTIPKIEESPEDILPIAEHLVHFEKAEPEVTDVEQHDPFLEVTPLTHSILKPAHFELNSEEREHELKAKRKGVSMVDATGAINDDYDERFKELHSITKESTTMHPIPEVNKNHIPVILLQKSKEGDDNDSVLEDETKLNVDEGNLSDSKDEIEEHDSLVVEETRKRREELLYYPKREKVAKIFRTSDYLMNIPSKDSTTEELIEWKPEDLPSHISEGRKADKTFYLIVKKNSDKPLSEEIRLKALEVFPHRTFIPEHFKIVQEISPMQDKTEDFQQFFESYRILVLQDDTPEDAVESEEVNSHENSSDHSKENLTGESHKSSPEISHSNESSSNELESQGESGESEEEEEEEEEEENEEEEDGEIEEEEDEEEGESEPVDENELSPEELIEVLKQVKCIEDADILKSLLESGDVPRCVIEELETEVKRRKERDRAFAAVLGDDKNPNACLCSSLDDVNAPGTPTKELEVIFTKIVRGRNNSNIDAELLDLPTSAGDVNRMYLYGSEYEGEGLAEMEEFYGEDASGEEFPGGYDAQSKMEEMKELEEKLEKAYALMNTEEVDQLDIALADDPNEELSEELAVEEETIVDKTCREIHDIEHHKFKHRDALSESIVKTRELYSLFHQENPGFFHYILDTSDICHSFVVLQNLAEECIQVYKEMLRAPEDNQTIASYGGMNTKDSKMFLEHRLQHYRDCSTSWVKGLDTFKENGRVCCEKVGPCSHIFSEKKRCPADILEPTLPGPHYPTKFKNPKSVNSEKPVRVIVDSCFTDQYRKKSHRKSTLRMSF